MTLSSISTLQLQWENCSPEELILEEIKNILKHTKAHIEDIVSNKKQKISEALARPNSKFCRNLVIWVNDTPEQIQKKALYYLLDLVEQNNLTFMLFERMMELIGNLPLNSTWQYKKFSINSYPADIENENFLPLLESCGFSDRLIIELTEKHQRTDQLMDKLRIAKEKYKIEIAVDDIAMQSSSNFSLETLENFENAGVWIDRAKIDGYYFQEIVRQENYQILSLLVSQLYKQYTIDKVTIEWIEEEKHYLFAKRLEQDFPDIDFRYQGYYFNKES